jgi:hypothetical protein
LKSFRFRLSRKFFVRGNRSRNHASQRINEQIRILAAIESEGHFFTVGLEMLRADFMPRSHNAALQARECRFDGIGVNASDRIDTKFVANSFVSSILSETTRCTAVGVEIVALPLRHKAIIPAKAS